MPKLAFFSQLQVSSLIITENMISPPPPPRCADKWSPALQIRTVLLSIQALLSAPNPDDPLANDVAEQWKKEESKAIETGINKQEDPLIVFTLQTVFLPPFLSPFCSSTAFILLLSLPPSSLPSLPPPRPLSLPLLHIYSSTMEQTLCHVKVAS